MKKWWLNPDLWPKNESLGFDTSKQSKHWVYNGHWIESNWIDYSNRCNVGITSWFSGQDQIEKKRHLI